MEEDAGSSGVGEVAQGCAFVSVIVFGEATPACWVSAIGPSDGTDEFLVPGGGEGGVWAVLEFFAWP